MCPLWSKETVLKLIAYYRCKEVLWDPKNPNYYNGILKNRAWVQLGLEMNCPVLRVKKKIESLSASLRREKAKRKKAGQGFTSSWIFYKPLLFLLHRRKIDANDNSQNSMSGESTQSEPGPKAEVDTDEEPQNSTEEPDFTQEQSEEEPQSPPHSAQEAKFSSVCYPELENVKQYKRPKLNSFKRPAVPKRMRQFSESQKMVTSVLEVLANASVAVKDAAAKTDDDDQIYANFLASKFRNYSQHTRNVLQHKINNLLFQADSGHFEYQTTVVFEPPYQEKPVECLLEGSDEAA